MQETEVCWNITTRCNQNCKYCHKFLNIDELEFEKNKQILMNLIKDEIRDITWTGGEALLYPNLKELLKIAKENGVNNKLITNGMILAQSQDMMEILNYLDCITLSIDSIDDEINEKLGRGKKHYSNIKKILEQTKNLNILTNINTVVSQKNINNIKELVEFLNNYKINCWRVFKFMPLREVAAKNKKEFEITDEQFEEIKNTIKAFNNTAKIEYRKESDMEEKYILIVANGDIIKTEKGKDIKKGNALSQRLGEFID